MALEIHVIDVENEWESFWIEKLRLLRISSFPRYERIKILIA